MHKLLLTGVFSLITGCADTPENRALWNGVGAGMYSAGEALNQQAAEMRQSLHQQNQQPYRPQVSQPVSCITRYNSMFRAYETVCN